MREFWGKGFLREQVDKEANEIEQLFPKKNSKKPRAACYVSRWYITLVVFGSINIISFFLPPSYLNDEER